MVEGLEFLAELATVLCTGSDHGLQGSGNALGLLGIVALLNPFGSKGLELFGSSLGSVAEQLGHALLHLLVTKGHTETEFAEVLEQ